MFLFEFFRNTSFQKYYFSERNLFKVHIIKNHTRVFDKLAVKFEVEIKKTNVSINYVD